MSPWSGRARTGALVISLDFELHWGIRHRAPATGEVREHLLRTRAVVPRLLELFAERDVAATWATVGFLFARSRAELEAFSPRRRPRYENRALDPYEESVGEDEASDPLHLAHSLVEQIAATPRQELASHSFSHYLCLERGQLADDFRQDLHAAQAIANASGHVLRSLVFPSNELNPSYLPILRESNFVAYRGNQPGMLNRPRAKSAQSLAWRAARVADAYVPLETWGLHSWDQLVDAEGLCNVPASRFLRPYSRSRAGLEPLRLRRIVSEMQAAARSSRIYHLWWHPHNFGTDCDENLAVLTRLLDAFAVLRDRYDMSSLSMAEVAGQVLGSDR